MSTQKDKTHQKNNVLYSEDFQAMLEKLEEEDNAADANRHSMKKSRLCIEKVKALEKHFEVENRLQPERKVQIAEEVGLEPRQVAIWFQNRRARWRAKQLEKEYDALRANYDALKHDYGSLELEKVALLDQLKDLKAKIKSRKSDMDTSPSIPSMINTSNNVKHESTSMNVVPSSCTTTSFDPFAMSVDGIQVYKAYQDHLLKMEELGVHNIVNDISAGNFFSVDQAPTMHYWFNSSDQMNNYY